MYVLVICFVVTVVTTGFVFLCNARRIHITDTIDILIELYYIICTIYNPTRIYTRSQCAQLFT